MNSGNQNSTAASDFHPEVADPPVADVVTPPVGEPTTVGFLTPISRIAPARKTHRLIHRGDGTAEIKTSGYGDEDKRALRFFHRAVPVADIEALYEKLRLHSQFNNLAIRGEVRPDADAVIFRRQSGDNADILDSGSRLVVIDLDNEVAPADLDTDDDGQVVEFIRGRLPAELRDVSCVVQFSNSYGLWRIDPRREKELKAHVWFLNDAPLTGPELRRWYIQQNQTGDCAQVDPNLSSANQAIYCSTPIFEGCADPVPTRLFLMLSADGVDVASIRPPPAAERVVVAPPADGVAVRCPGKLNQIAGMIRQASEGNRHSAILKAGYLAGGYVAGGAFTENEAVSALLGLAIESGSDNAEKTLFDALDAGKAAPICVESGEPLQSDTELVDLPTAAEATAALETALVEFFDEAAAGATPRLGIRGAAGLGKTTRALTMANDRGLIVDHYVPTHKLAQEQADRLPPGAAIAIRGRTHTDENRAPLCAKFEAADELQAAGFGRSQQRLLCGKADSNGRFPCPHANGCGYHAQFKSEATIRFYSHEWLTIGLSGDKPERAPDVAIVDENFSKAFEDSRQWRLPELAEEGGAFFVIGDAVRTGALNKEAHLPSILLALASRPPSVELPIHAGMSADKTIRALRRWKKDHPEKRAPYEFLECVKAALNNGETDRLYATADKGVTTIRFAGLKPLAASAPSWLFLDASLNPAMVQTIRPGTEVVTIEAQRNVRIVQITDSALSKTRLKDNACLLYTSDAARRAI